uniref:CNOT1_TTP_bind domain-containing protein n=1 Tax=Heterorhabditis bacteriophora TaxID=37862 RepID=A0A1I7X309_HETBA
MAELNGRSVERMRYVSKELKCIIDNFRWCLPRCFLGTVFMRQTVWRQEVALQRNSLTDLGFITYKFLAFTDIRSLILHGYDFTEEFCLWFMNACQESSIAVQRRELTKDSLSDLGPGSMKDSSGSMPPFSSQVLVLRLAWIVAISCWKVKPISGKRWRYGTRRCPKSSWFSALFIFVNTNTKSTSTVALNAP